VWIHEETEQEGKQAARAGKPLKPMESRDPLSWAAGWMKTRWWWPGMAQIRAWAMRCARILSYALEYSWNYSAQQ